MKRVRLIVALVAAVVAACLVTPLTAQAATPPTKRVIIILATYLDWPDLTATSTPTLYRMIERGGVAAVNARTRGRDLGVRATPLDGALSISAGCWAVLPDMAPAAYNVGEHYEVGTAAEAYERATGIPTGRNAIVFLGNPLAQRMNLARPYPATTGALGQAIGDAGGTVAAIGNSDTGYVTGEVRFTRPAALAAMNLSGLVPYGDVSSDVLVEDPDAPFGFRTDLTRFEAELSRVATETAGKGPSLIVLDPGDIYRVMRFRTFVTPEVYTRQRVGAMQTLDAVTALAMKRFPDATVAVVSLATGEPTQGDPEGLGPLIVAGPNAHGLLTSDTTHRDGLVTHLDVSATTLDLLGIDRPVEVLGSTLRSVPSAASTQKRIAGLAAISGKSLAVDSVRAPVINTFVACTVILLILSAFALARAGAWSARARSWWVRILKGGFLLVAVVPASSWLMFGWMPWPSASAQVVIGIIATALALWALAVLVWRATSFRMPLALVSLATALTIFVDQWIGSPGSVTNLFGYSPLLAARFYGMGNEAAAIAFGALIVGFALLIDEWRGSMRGRLLAGVGLILATTAYILTAAAPQLGANVGVVIWGTIGCGLFWALANGRPLSWRLAVVLVLLVVVTIGAFSVIDLASKSSQTHLGRALTSAEQGGVAELWTIIARKAQTNARVLTHTNWAYILLATLALLGFMRWRPTGDFALMLEENPAFGHAITVSMIAGLVAYFSEDSGIVIPALAFFFVGTTLAWLMLSRMAQADNGVVAQSGTEAAPEVHGESAR